MEYSTVPCMRQSSSWCPTDSLGCLLCNFSLARASGTNLASQSSFGHDQRVPCAHGGEVQHYRMAGLNLLVAIVIHWNPSISTKRSDSGNVRD